MNRPETPKPHEPKEPAHQISQDYLNQLAELCGNDAHHFTSFPIAYGEVEDITEQQVYRLFIKMNTSGTPVSAEHLNKIKSLIK